jgi:hypothetical protein
MRPIVKKLMECSLAVTSMCFDRDWATRDLAQWGFETNLRRIVEPPLLKRRA